MQHDELCSAPRSKTCYLCNRSEVIGSEHENNFRNVGITQQPVPPLRRNAISTTGQASLPQQTADAMFCFGKDYFTD